jgi:hypothetical protein
MTLPQFILGNAAAQLHSVSGFNTEQFIILNQYLSVLVKLMKSGRYTSFEELNEAVIEEILKLNDPYLY